MTHLKQIVCRVCLQCDLDPANLSSIFEKSDNVLIYEKVNTIADVHIKPEDGLPDKICGDCLLELENAINFKQKCETSNSILLSAVNTGIGVAQDDEDPLDTVKSEPEEYADQEYLEEDVWSPSEMSIKPDPDPQLSDTELQTLPAKKSKAIDLKLECHDCGGSFPSKCKLKVHWKKVHLKEQLTCPICKKSFGSFKRRKKHDVVMTRRCKTFSQVNVMGEGKHRVLHCRECEYSTPKIEIMTAHLVKHTGARNCACKFCPKRFAQLSGLQCHMESAHGTEKQRLCKICGELVMGRAKYNSHLKRHRNENAFVKCEVCNKQMKKGSLKDHMTVHSNERPFACDQCGATYKTFAGLWTHIQNVHQQDRVFKVYKCDKCEYNTKNDASMKRHKSRHTGNDFPCTECGKFFENGLQLSLHKQRHAIRDHKCSQCDSTYFSRKILLVHINKKHNTYLA